MAPEELLIIWVSQWWILISWVSEWWIMISWVSEWWILISWVSEWWILISWVSEWGILISWVSEWGIFFFNLTHFASAVSYPFFTCVDPDQFSESDTDLQCCCISIWNQIWIQILIHNTALNSCHTASVPGINRRMVVRTHNIYSLSECPKSIRYIFRYLQNFVFLIGQEN